MGPESAETNDLLVNQGGKVKEPANKKEMCKQLNTIFEEKQKDIETKGCEFLDEKDVVDDDDISAIVHASQEKVSCNINKNIPKIMISKDRIAV